MPSIAKRGKKLPRPTTGLLSPKYRERSTFSVPEATEILGISLRNCWDAVWGEGKHKGERLPSIKIGGRVIIPRQAIERLLSVG